MIRLGLLHIGLLFWRVTTLAWIFASNLAETRRANDDCFRYLRYATSASDRWYRYAVAIVDARYALASKRAALARYHGDWNNARCYDAQVAVLKANRSRHIAALL